MRRAAIVPLWIALLALAQGCPSTGRGRRPDDAAAPAGERSKGCVECHGLLDAPTMHDRGTVELGCTDCHGGDAAAKEKEEVHVRPRHPERWPSSANPEVPGTLYNEESPEFIRFVNPGDLRVAGLTCGRCHASQVRRVRKSMMAAGTMLWGAALYNNGVVPYKNPRHAEAYAPDGTPLQLRDTPAPTPEETARTGRLPSLDPLSRFEIGQPSNILRV
ncbi:MAG: hypothetical protein ACE5JG_04230, partial [Planctomycetota bacterium]